MLLTQWSRALPEKLIIPQLVKKWLVFYYIYEGLLPCSQKPSTHPLLHQINIDHSHHISWWSSLILSCHLCLGFTIGSFIQVSLQKPCIHFYSPHACQTPHLCIFLTLDHPNNMWCIVQIMKFLIITFHQSAIMSFLLSLEHSPHHLILDHPELVFFS